MAQGDSLLCEKPRKPQHHHSTMIDLLDEQKSRFVCGGDDIIVIPFHHEQANNGFTGKLFVEHSSRIRIMCVEFLIFL